MSNTTAHSIHALILDMDGVIWRDNQAIGDLSRTFSLIHDHGLKVTLATNNATQSVNQYIDKLGKFGVEIKPKQIITSAVATVHYLHKIFPKGCKVFVIGETGLINTLSSSGFPISEDDVQAVVVSFDRQLTYDKLRKATLLIRTGLPFIATNVDKSFPTPEGLIPGAGAILAAVVAATDTDPIVIGKPQPEMYNLAMQRMKSTPDTTLVVGDRLETDIAGAQKLGCRTALVLSGVTTESKGRLWEPKPEWIEADLYSLLRKIR